MKQKNIALTTTGILFFCGLLFSTVRLNAQLSFAEVFKTTDSHAAKTPAINVMVSQTDTAQLKFTLLVNNYSGKKAVVGIEGPTGNLYSKVFNERAFTQTFDFSTVEDGVYKFVIACGREKICRTINISTETAVARKAAIE
jgi:hypothetical protein